MIPIGHCARLMVAVASVLVVATSRAAADVPATLVNDRIEIAYVEPGERRLRPIHDDLKARRVLETLREFLSPLVLPVTLKMTAKECGEANAFWSGRARGLVLCYEYIDWFARLAPADVTAEGVTRREMIIGKLVGTALHELGHAVFDIYDIPVFGSEEDAADQVAGFLMLQFGKDVARFTINGTAAHYRAKAEQNATTRSSFSDTHGADEQRLYNFLCIGYGGDSAAFGDLRDRNLLPEARAQNCGREYEQVRNAFAKTIYPHLDPEKVKAVQAVDWLARFGP